MEHEQQTDSPSLLRVGLIGDPVAHSYSPRFQQAAFDACGIPAHYELWRTEEGELSARIASLLAPQSLGANITIPYKEAVLPLLDVVDPLAARIGAVNTIVHRNEYLYGYNTDAPGLLHALVELGVGKLREPQYLASAGADELMRAKGGDRDRTSARGGGRNRASAKGGDRDRATARVARTFPLDGRALQESFSFEGYTVVLLGAGGAARGAAFALVNASVERLVIVNRNLERAQRLAAEVQQESNCQVFCLNDPEFLIPHPATLIINATPLGMHIAGKQEQREAENASTFSPMPAEILARFAPDTVVFDMIYNPTQTQLLCQARTLGLRAVNGLPMLLHQGALAFTLWTGQPAPLEVMRSSLL
jgi:shikimate dehydrogenase